MPRAQRRLAVGWLVALSMAALPLAAQQSTAPGVQVKAAYLLKFAGFVEWPKESFAGPDTPFVIAVYGEEEVHAEVFKLAPGRRVLGRPVETVNVSAGAAIPPGIHVLYVGARGLRTPPGSLAARRHGVLLVFDGDGGWQAGAALWFVEADGRLRFDASPAAAEQSGLKLSARLLGVARRVIERAP